MRTKVEKLQDLFVARIQSGDFEVVEIKERYATISVDGYKFTFGNVKGYNDLFQFTVGNFMELPKINNCAYVIEAIDKGIKEAKIKVLNKLQQEIQEL
jgi:hypothetical protein